MLRQSEYAFAVTGQVAYILVFSIVNVKNMFEYMYRTKKYWHRSKRVV